MKYHILTLFPEMINAVMRESIIGRAQDKGVVEVKATNIRDYALDKHHKADDAPYGGGRGQVMLAEPLYLCHQRRIRIFPFQHVKAVGRIRRMDCNLRMEEAGLQTDQQRLIQILQIADQVDEGHFFDCQEKTPPFLFCSGC